MCISSILICISSSFVIYLAHQILLMKKRTTPQAPLLFNSGAPFGSPLRLLNRLCFLLFTTLLLSSCSQEALDQLDLEAKPVEEIPTSTPRLYKGIFVTGNSDYRGTIQIELPHATENDMSNAAKGATAALRLHTGEVFKLKSSTSSSDNKAPSSDFNVYLESQDMSLNFFLDANGNPVVSDVVFKNQDGSVTVVEETSGSTVTPITGIYKCTNCEDKDGTLSGIPLNNDDRVFNMILTDSAGETTMTIQAVLGVLLDAEIAVEESCTTSNGFTYCTIKSGPNAGSDPVTWAGVHRYSKDSSGETCSTLSGNLSFVSSEAGTIEAKFVSDNSCGYDVYYVSPSGNDNNTGLSPDDAWQSIAKLNTVDFQPGETILFEGGNSFSGNLYLDANDANDSRNPVRISSYGNGKATINAGTSFGIYGYNTAGVKIDNLIIAGSGMSTNQKFGIQFYNDLAGNVKLDLIEVTNSEIYGFKDFGIAIGAWNGNSGFNNVLIENNKVYDILDAGISSYGQFSSSKVGYAHSNIVVRSCEVFNIKGYNKGNNSGNGIVLSDVQYSKIEYSTVYNSGSGNTFSGGGPVGIWYWDADNVVIQFNEVYGMSSATKDGGGFDLDGGVTNGIIQYNYSHDNTGGGYLIGQFTGARPMQNITVRYNISQNDAGTNGGGIYLFNGGGVNDMKDIYIYNNTVYLSEKASNTASAAIKFLDWKTISSNVNVNNNILYTENGADLVIVPSTHNARFAGNLYFSTGTFKINYKGTAYSSLEAFRATGNEKVDNIAVGHQGDPLLTDAGKGGTLGFKESLSGLSAYKLTTGSPAVDLGIKLSFDCGTQDFYGNNISYDSYPEIGAHGSLSNSDAMASN